MCILNNERNYDMNWGMAWWSSGRSVVAYNQQRNYRKKDWDDYDESKNVLKIDNKNTFWYIKGAIIVRKQVASKIIIPQTKPTTILSFVFIPIYFLIRILYRSFYNYLYHSTTEIKHIELKLLFKTQNLIELINNKLIFSKLIYLKKKLLFYLIMLLIDR